MNLNIPLLKQGLKLSNSEPGCRDSGHHFFVKYISPIPSWDWAHSDKWFISDNHFKINPCSTVGKLLSSHPLYIASIHASLLEWWYQGLKFSNRLATLAIDSGLPDRRETLLWSVRLRLFNLDRLTRALGLHAEEVQKEAFYLLRFAVLRALHVHPGPAWLKVARNLSTHQNKLNIRSQTGRIKKRVWRDLGVLDYG